MYGLSDASLKWYTKVKKFVTDNNGIISKIDPSLFLWYNTKQAVVGIMTIHVDDFLCTGDNGFIESFISKLQENFAVGKIETKCFKYLGLNIKHEGNIVTLDQQNYVDNLSKIDIDIERRKNLTAPLTTYEKEILQSKIGQLLWLCNQTRPDISFHISNLASNLNRATINQLIHCNKIISKVKSNNLKLQYQKLQGDLKLVVYTDASFGNLNDGGSQGAYLIFFVASNGCCNLLSWQSKRLKRIARSSLAAETIAMLDGLDATLYISELLKETYKNDKILIEVYTDNKSHHEALQSSKYVTDKCLRIDIGALKEIISNKQIENIIWIKSAHQIADSLTKHGANSLPLINVLQEGHFQIQHLS